MSLKLSEVPHILEILSQVLPEPLSKLQRDEILTYAEENGMLAADAAVELGIAGRSDINKALGKQSVLRVDAAREDIKAIMRSGKQQTWIRLKWNTTAQPREKLTLTDSAMLVANTAQKIALMANNCPEIAEDVEHAIMAASKLVEKFSNAPTAYQISKEEVAKQWQLLAAGLKLAVQKSNEAPQDTDGNFIDIENYIARCGIEVTTPHTELVGKMEFASSELSPAQEIGRARLKGNNSFNAQF